MCKPYSGYVNYQTWVTALWLDNDQGMFSYWSSVAFKLARENAETATQELAELLQETHEENSPLENAGGDTYSDLLAHALGMVDWNEIAEGFVESATNDLREEEDDDDDD